MDSSIKTVIVKDDSRMYTLWSDTCGNQFLTAMAGGIGMYEVTIKLDTGETERIVNDGQPYLDDLVYRLSRECLTTYRGRLIHGNEGKAP
jgi:hypothetical protein